MSRKSFTVASTLDDIIVQMSEGNPGAMNVLLDMIDHDPNNAILSILSLDDMNIRGSQIWIGYKDHCGQDMDNFIKAVQERDTAMIDKINEQGALGNHKEKAIPSGASSMDERPTL